MGKINERFWNALELEEYVISIVLYNQKALARAMSELDSRRDFKDPKLQKAFAVIEGRYEAQEDVDVLVLVNEWVDMAIFSNEHEAKRIATKSEGDHDYEPKIKELRRSGGMRKAQSDIQTLFKASKEDTDPETLAQKAYEAANSWITGSTRKYLTAEEVEEQELNQKVGEKLLSGIPLLDNVLYKNAGQRKGTVKATIFREKHGKTRHACWEVAQDLRQGHKVLYVTLEGSNVDIKDNIKQVLQDEWSELKGSLLQKDGTVDADEIQATILEAVFAEDIDKVVIDYLQLMKQPKSRMISENENTNRCCQQITQMCVKHNLNMHYLSQARQADKMQNGYGNVPTVYDAYGSNQIIKDASIILVGFRPKLFETLVTKNSLGARVKAPEGTRLEYAPINSVFLKPILSRKKIDCLHMWAHFVDTDQGYKLQSQELL